MRSQYSDKAEMGNRNVIHLCSIEFDYQIKPNNSSFQIEPEQTNKQTKNKTQKISLFDICHYFAEKNYNSPQKQLSPNPKRTYLH